jgi:hypothetical protein
MEERKLCSKYSEPSEVRQVPQANPVTGDLNVMVKTPAHHHSQA